MKKLVFLLITIALMTFFTSCTAKEYDSFKELNGGLKIQQGSIIYSFYGALPSDSLIGKQIGIVNGEKKHKVFEVNGFSTDEWVIEYYDVIMSTYAVYSSDTVTEVPNELIIQN